MQLVRSITAIAFLAATGLAVGSTTASAYICIAKNANGVEWVGRSPILGNAKDKAKGKCIVGSRPIYKSTCVIKSCT